jgi:hypothetical protein
LTIWPGARRPVYLPWRRTYRALGTGAAWPDAFQQAFGMTVSAYYADFAVYRATL